LSVSLDKKDIGESKCCIEESIDENKAAGEQETKEDRYYNIEFKELNKR